MVFKNEGSEEDSYPRFPKSLAAQNIDLKLSQGANIE